MSSIWGLRGASCEVTYSATKGALIALTRSLASELAPTGIRVNCVAPGVIKTDMLDALPPEVLPQLAQETPLGRLGTPEDIWRLIEAGYEERLRITFWAVGMLVGAIPFPILMVQALQTVGCIFWKNGLCELHDLKLKPTEGRLSYHILTEESICFSKSLSWNVAKEWINVENIPLITRILQRMAK